ncbi:hypothetical protein GSMA_02250 [Serratia marcescens subsp. marcescens ATCC 13880]|nr:hypothetical protein GSMA_02250 [Serratia marcescens subsp. marcescens ATCC 13880]
MRSTGAGSRRLPFQAITPIFFALLQGNRPRLRYDSARL